MPANTDISRVLDEIVTAVQFHEGGTFRPTLVVGLGGSGVNTARRLKRLLHERYQVQSLIGFLFMDTDQSPYQEDFNLAPVDEHEKATIFVHNPEQLLEEYRKQPKLHPYFENILNENLDVTMLRNADGAAGIRPVGRFAFHASFDVLYTEYLEPAVHRIMQVQEHTRAMMQGVPKRVEITHSQPRIYLICSLCGGTGSAIYMDTAMILRYIMEQNNLDGEIVGVFYLPSVFRNESGISAALVEVIESNAYATLMELEYLCNPRDLLERDWTFRFPVIGEYRLREPLVDEVFLVEGTNQSGQSLSNKQHAFEMVARSLLLDIGSPIGAQARSAKRNSLAVIDTIPCAETGLPRLMNSLAVTSLAVPVRDLLRYCAVRAAQEMFSGRAHTDTVSQEGSEVEQFLRTNGLEERGSSNQILERLLKDADGKRYAYNPPSVSDIQNEARGSGKSNIRDQAQYLREWFERQVNWLEEEWLPGVQKHIAQKAVEVLKEAKQAIGNRSEGILNERRHDAAIEFLKQLEAIFNKVCDDFTKEIRQHDQKIHEALEGMQRGIEQLQSIANGPWWRLGRRDELDIPADQARQSLMVYAEQNLLKTASEQVLKILNGDVGTGEKSLISRLKEWRGLVANWKTHEQNTTSILRENLPAETFSRRANSYELEWLALLRRDFDVFYDSLKPTINFGEIRRRYSELKEKFPHEPAFGSLSSTHIGPYQEAEIRIAAAAEVLSDQVRAKANILDIVEQGEQQGPRAEYLRRKLSMLFEVCQPFWSTSDPPGEPRYETYVAVSIPPATNGRSSEEMLSIVQRLSEEQGVKSQLVPDGYPFAITVLKRCYGARAYYLRSANRMRNFYERRAANEQVYHRLHVDKRFFTALPKIHPVYRESDALELWAWGIAFGYIAQKGDRYYLNVQKHTQQTTIPKYSSDWPLLITEHLPSDWQKRVYQRYTKGDLLGIGRQQAMDAFCENKEQQRIIREVRQHIERKLTLARELDLLDDYSVRLVEMINSEPDHQVAEQLRRENEAIKSYMSRIEERLDESYAG